MNDNHMDMQRLFQNSIDMFGTAGLDGYFQSLNPAWEATLGWTTEELRSKPFIDFVHPDDVEKTNAESARIADGATIITFENRYRCKDGSYRRLGWTAVPDMDEGLLYFVARDVSEAYRQRKLLDTVLDNMPSGLLAVEAASGKTLIANRLAEDILGRGINPDVGADDMNEVYAAYRYGTDDIYPSKELPLIRGLYGETTQVDDMEVRKPDGERVLLEVVGTPIKDESGAITGSVINFTDITERMQNEADLKLFQVLADNAVDGIAIADMDGTITYANKVYATLFGWGDDIIGVNTAQTIASDLRESQLPKINAGALGGGWTGESQGVHKDGTVFPVQASIFSIKDENDTPVKMVAFMRDISEQKRAETEREQLQQEIIEAQRQALKELSTPIIPVMDGVIILPLIGAIDSYRARDITRSLLAGITEHRVRVVILDVTGVPVVDSSVADNLNKTIQAARLKGARTIVSGISDAVAETIVDLGIDWSQIDTVRDLQTGLRLAMENIGQ